MVSRSSSMKTILIGTLVFILIVGIALLGWYYLLRQRYRKTIAKKYHIIAPLIEKLARKEKIAKTDVESMVRNATLRYATYHALEAYGRMELFPSDYLSIESGAESFLITWLEFPTELGQPPHEIELFATIALDGVLSLTYYVFKYRMQNNHWAASNNWMFGVVGPYGPRSKPYDMPAKIFSRFNTTETSTAEDEVRWVHENVR